MSESPAAPNHPQWEAEKTYPELVEAFKTALRAVSDPEIGLDIIQLGLVRDLVIDDQSATITMILTTPFCPYGPSLIESAREKAEEVLKRTTTINYGNEVWDFSTMEDGIGFDWGIYGTN